MYRGSLSRASPLQRRTRVGRTRSLEKRQSWPSRVLRGPRSRVRNWRTLKPLDAPRTVSIIPAGVFSPKGANPVIERARRPSTAARDPKMSTQHKTRKLVLNRESVRRLDTQEEQAIAGAGPGLSYGVTCFTSGSACYTHQCVTLEGSCSTADCGAATYGWC